MPIKFKAIPASLIFSFLLTFPVFAQIKTVKGNYCGSTYGNAAGSFGFRIGSKLMIFELEFGRNSDTRMIRFNVNKLKVGDEFIIKYDASGEELLFIKAITGTRKRKATIPCNLEDEENGKRNDLFRNFSREIYRTDLR